MSISNKSEFNQLPPDLKRFILNGYSNEVWDVSSRLNRECHTLTHKANFISSFAAREYAILELAKLVSTLVKNQELEDVPSFTPKPEEYIAYYLLITHQFDKLSKMPENKGTNQAFLDPNLDDQTEGRFVHCCDLNAKRLLFLLHTKQLEKAIHFVSKVDDDWGKNEFIYILMTHCKENEINIAKYKGGSGLIKSYGDGNFDLSMELVQDFMLPVKKPKFKVIENPPKNYHNFLEYIKQINQKPVSSWNERVASMIHLYCELTNFSYRSSLQ